MIDVAGSALHFLATRCDCFDHLGGVRELRLAVKRGWVAPKTLITELQTQIAPTALEDKEPGAAKLPVALRTQKTEWLADAGVLLLKAPVEALPFVRLGDNSAQTL